MYETEYSTRYLETLDEWRESRETTEELKYSLAQKDKTLDKFTNDFYVAGIRLEVIISALKQYKDNPNMIEECATALDMVRERFVLNHNDIQTKD
jgi:nitrate reductase alpha subunit